MDTDKDQELFRQISIDIREHRNNYKIAGEWLDKYCSEDNYWKRKETELKEAVEKCKGTVNPIWQKNVAKLRNDIERHESTLFDRFDTARRYWLEKYTEQNFISEDNARCIILITWLLTDADAEKTNLNITYFEKWPWEPVDNIFNKSRCAASSLWSQKADAYASWMRLVRFAWEKVESQQGQKPAETEQKATFSKVQRIWIWFKTHPHIYGLIGSVIFLILFFILGLLKSQWRNWCWGTAVLALLVLILSLLGGRSRQ